ncbi:hypothetical protein [Kiloniella laminariae]|uniref:hypothetical protein n=1 Tax=Kiloniella laminariae TaxID=454162 RepID=UPI000374FBBA|nr:hypothetical protein [Kiloniella laminariae]
MPAQQTTAQALALLGLRVTVGMLLVWWGMAKVINPEIGVMISRTFYWDLFSDPEPQYRFGYFQFVIGACVTLGLMEKYATPILLVMTLTSAAAIWQALLDPFDLYLPLGKVTNFQHFFYPTAIIIAGALTLMAFRGVNRLSLDYFLKHHRFGA